MAQDRQDRIQQRAYEIWKNEGHPSGQDQEHWYRAEREIEEEEKGSRQDLERPEATVKSPEPIEPPEQKASQGEEAAEAMKEVSQRKRKR